MISISQDLWNPTSGWTSGANSGRRRDSQLVLAFANTAHLEGTKVFDELRLRHPRACIVGCSTAGGIAGPSFVEDGVISTALAFDSSRVIGVKTVLAEREPCSAAARRLVSQLPTAELVHVLVLSDGTCVNGSDLARSLVSELPAGVQVSGGLAGDGERFSRTLVFCDGPAEPRAIVAVGFYGRSLRTSCGSRGGWDPFGPDRLITRSNGNVLYALDGEPALGLYKRYLGEHAAGLPSTGLLFPLSVRSNAPGACALVRTILAVDERSQSLIFAGDVPQGSYARLMRANFDRLIEGSQAAAQTCAPSPQFSVLISCVGRKLVLRQRVDEEIEAAQAVFGAATMMTGFYSYGELAPHSDGGFCDLHNQSMTITTFSEA